MTAVAHRISERHAEPDAQGRGDAYCDRMRRPRETVAIMRKHMASLGITRLARVTGLDNVGIPVWAATRPNATTLSQSQGKGIDDHAAAASALMEAVEVATAERVDHPVVTASIAALRAQGRRVEAMHHLRRNGHPLLGDDEPIDWMAGTDLVSGLEVLAPRETVILTDGHGRRRYWQSTDGLASGNTRREAIFHGLCERIERDATVLGLFHTDDEIEAACVDPASFRDLVIDRLTSRIVMAGLQVRLFDLTTDIGIPVFGAFMSRPPRDGIARWTHFDLAAGYGCHPVPARAAIRAITEAAQTRVTTISAARDDFEPATYATELDESLRIYPNCRPRLRQGYDRVQDRFARPERYVDEMVEALRSSGLGPIIAFVLDERPGEFAVVKTLAPGLEGPAGGRADPFGPRARAIAESEP